MLYYLISLLVVVLDRLTKWHTARTLETGQAIGLIPGVLRMTYAENTGAAFSFLADANMRWVLVAVSGVSAIVIAVIVWRYRYGALGRASLALALGGALGNLIDRVLTGVVIDMFAFEFVNFAIFNVADVFITTGLALFAVHYIVSSSRSAKLTASAYDEYDYFDSDDDEPDGDAGQSDAVCAFLFDDGEVSETRILEAYDIERRISHYEDDADSQ